MQPDCGRERGRREGMGKKEAHTSLTTTTQMKQNKFELGSGRERDRGKRAAKLVQYYLHDAKLQ